MAFEVQFLFDAALRLRAECNVPPDRGGYGFAGHRKDLGLSADQPLDSLKLEVEGVEVYKLAETKSLEPTLVRKLHMESGDEWSAMSVPLNGSADRWAVLLNDSHTKERQRVTILEEYWHILLGHKLTKIARVAEAYGRTYDKAEEHDAYYLASATLLPKPAIIKAVNAKQSSAAIAQKFGTSAELVDYRIKRLGVWRDHIGKKRARFRRIRAKGKKETRRMLYDVSGSITIRCANREIPTPLPQPINPARRPARGPALRLSPGHGRIEAKGRGVSQVIVEAPAADWSVPVLEDFGVGSRRNAQRRDRANCGRSIFATSGAA